MDAHKTNIHILIPVWGEAYLTAFMNTAMESLLAPDNIPFVAKNCTVTAVFLTTKESIEYIPRHDNFKRLSETCNVAYEPIDDLLAESSDYTMPLTLAYVRGITRTGQDMTNTYFIFFNADFILSNGSLAHVQKLIQQDNDIILATSFRANSGDILPELHELVDAHNGNIPSRALARLSLKHRHHTVISRTVNQSTYTNTHWNQVYWQVDSQTILARYFLTTLFCFRPTVYSTTIDSFIDYNMVGTFCPSGKIATIADSDDFFLLEMQNFKQELFFLKMGAPDVRRVADSASAWTTEWHRHQSRYETVIHGEELPPCLAQERRSFSGFMAEVEKKLAPCPLRPEVHHHWIGAIRLWAPRKMRYDRAHSGMQPFTGISVPLARLDADMEKKTRGRVAQAMALFLGVPPKAFPWHPLWGNYRAIRKAIRSSCPENSELLFITDSFAYDGIVMQHARATKIFAADALNGHLDKLCPGKKFSACFVAVECDNLDVQRIVKKIAPYLDGPQTVILFFGRTMIKLTGKNKHFMDVYYHAMSDLVCHNPQLSHIGNWLGLTLTKWMLDAINRIKFNPAWHLPQMLAVSVACLINNLSCAIFGPRRGTPGVTGVLAVFSLKSDKAS